MYLSSPPQKHLADRGADERRLGVLVTLVELASGPPDTQQCLELRRFRVTNLAPAYESCHLWCRRLQYQCLENNIEFRRMAERKADRTQPR